MDKVEILNTIRETGVIAIMRAQSSDQLIAAADAIKLGGVRAIEVTMTTPGALGVIAEAKERYGSDVIFGAGTVLDPETGRLTYVNGGQEPPVVVGSEGIKQQLTPTGPAVGMLPDLAFGVVEADLQCDDTLVVFTDGVTEAMSPATVAFGTERLFDVLGSRSGSADITVRKVANALRLHAAGASQSDDITLVAVRRC
jgi:hypothetical protein